MSGMLDIGTRALKANQVAIQTAGNNIANVNTPGYSRQSVVIQNVAGQFSGTGYYGKGVEVLTVQRNHSEFLTRQAAQSGAIAAADTTRMNQLKQLEDIFEGGPSAIGASVSNMLNAFSDVASAPTDLTARTVALSLADEMTGRFRTASSRLNDLKQGANSQLKDALSAVNNLTGRIAAANEVIARAQGSGQSPIDLLDQRDQLISQLNQYIQTSSVAADDGTVSVFVAGSQPLVLGKDARPLSLSTDEFGDPAKTKLILKSGADSVTIEEATLGGGQMAGLLRFQNTDLVDAGNLLGRMALAIGTVVNDQHRLGYDLKGQAGGDLLTLNALPNALRSATNTGSATLTLALQTSPSTGATALAASNYELNFSSTSSGTITRLSDGQVSSFSSVTPLAFDGLSITVSAGTLASGDRYLVTPFSTAATDIKTAFSSPTALAMADTALYTGSNSGNAKAMMALRDLALFDGAAAADGYAGAMAAIGVKVQGATYAASVSQSIANNIEKDRSSVAGVNLDEEAAKLLQYQQSYQASAKMLQISQSIFDTLLQTISR